jgi:hypothetical protein
MRVTRSLASWGVALLSFGCTSSRGDERVLVRIDTIKARDYAIEQHLTLTSRQAGLSFHKGPTTWQRVPRRQVAAARVAAERLCASAASAGALGHLPGTHIRITCADGSSASFLVANTSPEARALLGVIDAVWVEEFDLYEPMLR